MIKVVVVAVVIEVVAMVVVMVEVVMEAVVKVVAMVEVEMAAYTPACRTTHAQPCRAGLPWRAQCCCSTSSAAVEAAGRERLE